MLAPRKEETDHRFWRKERTIKKAITEETALHQHLMAGEIFWPRENTSKDTVKSELQGAGSQMKSLAHSKRYNKAEFRELCSVRDTGGTETFHDIFKTVLRVASSPWKPADSSGYIDLFFGIKRYGVRSPLDRRPATGQADSVWAWLPSPLCE